MLWRRCGLCSRRIGKINIVLGGRGENVTKTLQNRISLPSVSTLLSPIVIRSHRRRKLFLLHEAQLCYFAISIYLMHIPSALVAFWILILKKRFFSRLTACWKWYRGFIVDLKLVCFCCFMKIPLFWFLMKHIHGILSCFDHRQNYRSFEGNRKIIIYKDGKTAEIIINHKGTRTVKDGENWHGLQTTKLKHLG